MSRTQNQEINFADTIGALAGGRVWEYETPSRGVCNDVPRKVFDALQRPVDFPPIEGAIVSGDQIALAVDPNVPGIVQIIQGTIKALGNSDAGDINIVLGDEATDETVEAIRDEVGDAARVVPHHSSDRGAVRYLAADEAADPVYLNRLLVDSDFVLPIVAGRPLDTCYSHDLTGVFPSFADSASRRRHCRQAASQTQRTETSNPAETSWLLGVQIMISVTSSVCGQAGQIIVGTPDAVRKQLTPSRRSPDEFPPPAPMVIASLDGDAQQQSWCNAARAIAAASRYVEPTGTIVLWSAIDDPPTGRMLNLSSREDFFAEDDSYLELGEDFPVWDESTCSAQTIARIAAQHRILIHSRLEDETIESMGLGSIASADQLARLSRSFDSCGVLRAAQFAGTTIDIPHQVA